MLSAIHTYMYKWSPIFCELGLQCLLSTTPLLKFFLEQFTLEDFPKDSLTTYFYQLVRKIWSGQFSIVYPRDFKSALGLFHVQFQDYRQVCLFYWDSWMELHLLLINFPWKLICAKHAQGQVCWNKIRGLCVKIILLKSHNIAVFNFSLSVYRNIDNKGNDVTRLEVLSNYIVSFYSKAKQSQMFYLKLTLNTLYNWTVTPFLEATCVRISNCSLKTGFISMYNVAYGECPLVRLY